MIVSKLISLAAASHLLVQVQMGECPQAPPATVRVQLVASDPPLDTSMTQDELTANFANNPDSTLSTEPGWHLGGLTLSNVQTSYRSQMVQKQINANEGCVWASHVDVDIVYNPIIYIASDFLNKQCQYDLTLAHEERHVATDLQTFNDFTPAMQQQIEGYISRLGAVGPVPVETMDAVQDELLQHIITETKPVTDELADVRRERQAVFDTKENYIRENNMCRGMD